MRPRAVTVVTALRQDKFPFQSGSGDEGDGGGSVADGLAYPGLVWFVCQSPITIYGRALCVLRPSMYVSVAAAIIFLFGCWTRTSFIV